MSERKVLVTGVDEDGYDKLRAALARYPLVVERLSRPASALELAGSVAFDLVILGHPLTDPPLADFLAELRRPGSPSAASPVVLLAAAEAQREAGESRDAGVVAVLASDLEAPVLHRAVLQALGVPPRVDVRLLVRLEARLELGHSAVLCQTENLSRGGMLVRTDRRPTLGEAFSFELALPEGGQVVRGRAEVARHTDPAREPVRGIGLRFLSFESDGARRLAAYVERLL